MSNNIVLYLMTQKGYEVLKAVLPDYHSEIKAVVSSRDRNIKNDFYVEIKQLCMDWGVPFGDRKEEKSFDSTYALTISWRWMISTPSKLIVLHDSLLPKYRGFNPLVSALINGETEIGVSAVFAEKLFDRGDILLQCKTSIEYPLVIQRAIELVNKQYANITYEIIRRISKGEKLIGNPQNEEEATYSLWRDEEDYRIHWTESADVIQRFVDAVGYPYKGAFTVINGMKARVIKCTVVKDVYIENRHPGKVLFLDDGIPTVVCGKGLIQINELVDEGMGSSLLPLSRFRVRFK